MSADEIYGPYSSRSIAEKHETEIENEVDEEEDGNVCTNVVKESDGWYVD